MRFIRRNPKTKVFRLSKERQQELPGFTHMLWNSSTDHCELIGEHELLVWRITKKPISVGQISAAIFAATASVQTDYVSRTTSRWISLGLLISESRKRRNFDIYMQLENLLSLDIPMPRLAKLFNSAYDQTLAKFDSKILTIIYFLVLASGLISLAGFELGREGYFGQSMIAAPIMITYLSLVLHEIGHAIAMRLIGLNVYKVGVQLYLGLPMFYVDTSPAWIAPKWSRVLTAAGGVLMNLLIVSVALLTNFLSNNETIELIASVTVVINLSQIFFSLIPFLEMDGYYILSDLVGDPYLIDNSAAAAKKLWRQKSFTNILHSHAKYYLLFYIGITISLTAVLVYAANYWSDLVYLLTTA